MPSWLGKTLIGSAIVLGSLAACHAAAPSGPPETVIKQTVEKPYLAGDSDVSKTVVTFLSIKVAPVKTVRSNEFYYGRPTGAKVWPVLVHYTTAGCSQLNPAYPGTGDRGDHVQFFLFSINEFGDWSGENVANPENSDKNLYHGTCELKDLH